MLRTLSRAPVGHLPAAVALAATLFATSASAADVWVITDRQHPVQGTPDRLIELDAPARIEAELSARLPGDARQAASLLQHRLTEGGPALQQRLAGAYQGVADAWSLDITTLPAVLVARRYVVYGETNLARALARIERHRQDRP